MKFFLTLFMLGLGLHISAFAADHVPFTEALMNVEAFDWTSVSDRFAKQEQAAVQALVAAKPGTPEEAIAKAHALMTALKSSEVLLKEETNETSPSSRKIIHNVAWSGLIQLCNSEFAASVQPEVVSDLPQSSSHMSKFMNLVNSFHPISKSVGETIYAFIERVAGDICGPALTRPRPLHP